MCIAKEYDLISELDSFINSFELLYINEDEYPKYMAISENGFIITNKWILRLVKKGAKNKKCCYIVPVSTKLEIMSICKDIISGITEYKIKIEGQKETVTKIFDSSVLTSQGCSQLMKYGCIYNESEIKYLNAYLINSTCKVPVENMYSRLGWLFKDDDIVFLSGKSFSSNIKSEIDSFYSGTLDLSLKGSLEEWVKMVRAEVIGNIPLTFVLTLGFASIILGFLNHFMDLGCMIFNLVNTSSKGKTTAAMLAASIWGNPSFDKGLITTLNGTQNAILEFVSHNNSHTVVLDEAATGDKNNFRKMLYQICSGKERMRLNTEGEMKETHVFNSVIITTAEFFIIDQTAPNGIRARVFEISDQFTKSAENSENIKRIIFKNYGYAGYKFAKYVIEHKDNIITEYDAVVNFLKQKVKNKNDLTDRIMSKLAVIVLTNYYMNKCFNFNSSHEDFTNYILEIEKSVSSESDIAQKALDCIIQYVQSNLSKFLLKSDGKSCDFIKEENTFGAVIQKGKYYEISILKDLTEKILKDNNFENPREIYRVWQDRKLLVCEKDRPYKRYKLLKNLPKLSYFVFDIYDDISANKLL